MASKKSTVDLSQGIPTGLLVWLGFLLSLVALGYSVPLSILLGLFSGLAAAWLSACFQSKQEEIQESEEVSLLPLRQAGITEAQRRRKVREMKTPKGTLGLTAFLFNRNRS